MTKKLFFIFSFFISLVNIFPQQKPNPLRHYFNGRDLDVKGRSADAIKEYNTAITICLNELKTNPRDINYYVVYTWSLFRLKKYNETLTACKEALKIKQDPRIIETMGETLFYLNRLDESLAQMQRYISMAPTGDKVSVAYFFEAEIYRIRKQYNKAEIAYTAAVFFSPHMSLWWYRLGTMREAIQRKQEAIEAYSQAVKLWPNYTDALNALKRLQR